MNKPTYVAMSHLPYNTVSRLPVKGGGEKLAK